MPCKYKEKKIFEVRLMNLNQFGHDKINNLN